MAEVASNVIAGPAHVHLTDTAIGHTQGGTVLNVAPQNRGRSVDAFGDSEVAFIHNGDQVRITVPFAEWVVMTMQEIYDPGNDQASGSGTNYIGIGRTAGYVYSLQDLKIIPRLSGNSAKRCQFYKTCPIGEFELPYRAADDLVFNVEFAACVDDTKTDGELIGKIQLDNS